MEPPPAKPYDDETRLDMNAMIDVCLVLLVFFILTTSYAALQRLIDMPGTSQTRISGAPKITDKEVKELMIKVEVRMVRGPDDKDVPVVKIEGVAPDKGGRGITVQEERDRLVPRACLPIGHLGIEDGRVSAG